MSAQIEASEDKPAVAQAKLCRRCEATDPQHVVRQELLCQECFERYVKTKVIKRLEAFRGRHTDPKNPRRWLLPISGGPSSASLLHILDDNLQRQINRSGHANYELHCVHIAGAEGSESVGDPLERMKSRYTRHSYTVLPLISHAEAVESIKTRRYQDSNGDSAVAQASLLSLRSDLSISSQVDLLNILKHKTLVQAAQSLGCEGILLGHTTTRLAETVLAETAKGRGISLPALVNDYWSPRGIWIFYPMKDVLKKEMLQFSQLSGFSDLHLSQDHPISSQVAVKNRSIDHLMTGYFQSVEENYPSVVANVVRTSGKLQNSQSTPLDDSFCPLCEMPLESQAADSVEFMKNGHAYSASGSMLCHGCDKLITRS